MKRCGFASCEELTITENAWSEKIAETRMQNALHVERQLEKLKKTQGRKKRPRATNHQ